MLGSCRRIFKSLHALAYADDEGCRHDIKGMRNLQEGRQSLAAVIVHGKKGDLYQQHYKGTEDQLGALGLFVLNWLLRSTSPLRVLCHYKLPGPEVIVVLPWKLWVVLFT